MLYNDTLQKSLDNANGKARTRKLTLVKVLEAIFSSEKLVKSLPVGVREHIEFEYLPFRVAKSYNYSAYGTRLRCRFNDNGEAINITLDRAPVTTYEKSRIYFNSSETDNVVLAELKVELKKCGMNINGSIHVSV